MKREKSKHHRSAVEERLGITLSPRVRAFFENNEAGRYRGLTIAGLPHYGSDAAVPVQFVEPDFELFDDLSREDHPDWLPLAALGDEPQFLAVNFQDPAGAVAMWQHEDGMFHDVAPSLDSFLARLLKPGQVTPYGKLKRLLAKAHALHEKGKDSEALALLEPLLSPFVGQKPPNHKYEWSLTQR